MAAHIDSVMNTGTNRTVVCVRFESAGRTRYVALPEHAFERPLSCGDQVIVRSDEGQSFGKIVRASPSLASRFQPPVAASCEVVRTATPEDAIVRRKQIQREDEAHTICVMKIRERGLAMKLTRVEQVFDGTRLIFYFTAEGRIDFRELVRELAGQFHTRIEMRQIGVRDEARMLGGYGSCGRPLCCTTWLESFEPVSIRMAKQQNLSLNPSRLSGLCGRLKCCLRNEAPGGKTVEHNGCSGEGGCAGKTGCCETCSGACASGNCTNCR